MEIGPSRVPVGKGNIKLPESVPLFLSPAWPDSLPGLTASLASLHTCHALVQQVPDPGPFIPEAGIGYDLPHKALECRPWGLPQDSHLSLPPRWTLLLAALVTSFLFLFLFFLPEFTIPFHSCVGSGLFILYK